jgi:hypothetical protein
MEVIVVIAIKSQTLESEADQYLLTTWLSKGLDPPFGCVLGNLI